MTTTSSTPVTPLRLAFLVSKHGRLMEAVIRATRRNELACDPVVCIVDRPCAAVDTAAQWGVPAVLADRSRYEGEAAERVQATPFAGGDQRETAATIARQLLSDAILMALRQYEVDVALLTFDSLLFGDILTAYKHRLLNYHPALLPGFPGFGARRQALASGMLLGGGTLHLIDAGMDTGPIVSQWVCGLYPDDNASRYGDRQFGLGTEATIQALQWMAEGRIRVEEGAARAVVEGARYGQVPINPVEP